MSSSPTDTGTAEVVMPQMGVSVAEGTITEWTKQPGDWVAADETVCVVSTDKTDVEIPAPAAGRLIEALVEVDETVAVGTPLAKLDTAARPGEAHPEEHASDEPEQPTKTSAGQEPAGGGEATGRDAGAATGAEAAPGVGEAEPDRSRFHSPVVQRIAAEHDLDLSRVEGTGVGGRIRKRDVLAHLERGDGAAATDRRPEGADAPKERPLHTESPYRDEADEPAPAAAPAPATHAGAGGAGNGTAADREPMSPMRSAIAKHMVASRRTAAHCTTVVEVDMSAVAAARGRLKPVFAERGVPLTYLAFVAQAVVAELERFPMLNASVEGEEIVHHRDVNLGVAVALEPGLIVPVIHRAQRLSLEGLAAGIADVASRAREGRLEPAELGGGTFTITNPGQFGAVLATPIINQPEVGILDLEAIVKRPVVVPSEEGDAIAIRPMTNLCMSWDHRALDGADAARFLSAVKSRLERAGEGS